MISKPAPLRFRLYFWLMDACLLVGMLGFIDFIVTRTVGDFAPDATPMWYGAFAIIAITFSFIVAPFLIFARFMRDEYAEQLWNRTTNVLVTVAVFVPFATFLAAGVTFLATQAEQAPIPFSLMMVETNWWTAIAEIWKTFCLLFVAIFELLRWRDSR